MKVLKLEEAAEFLRISAYTLRQLASRKQVPSAKVGGEWRFTDESLEKYMRELVSPTQTTEQPGQAAEVKRIPYRRQPKAPPVLKSVASS